MSLWDPNEQEQEQEQLQAQANLQAQLQGQGQGQGQGQYQTAVQSLESSSENENWNANGNLNGNVNYNANENEVDNELDNKVDNEVDNEVDNKIDNDIENKIENTVENNVDVDVDVEVDLDLSADDLTSPVIDLGQFHTYGSVVMPDVVTQTMNDGNQFNIDQVNNLVDNDVNWSSATYNGGAGGSWYEPGASFSMEAKIEGGESKLDIEGNVESRANVVSSADAAINQSAFDQNITQGANIQFNSLSIQAAGNNVSDDDVS